MLYITYFILFRTFGRAVRPLKSAILGDKDKVLSESIYRDTEVYFARLSSPEWFSVIDNESPISLR